MDTALLVNSVLLFLSISLQGQTPISTKEISIEYANSKAVFGVCTSGCKQSFDERKEYTWYDDSPQIGSTKGGAEGSLLHGNYKLYDSFGILRSEKNYSLGLLDGNTRDWDSIGAIISLATYSQGICIYSKYQIEDNYWVEFDGPAYEVGTVNKFYSPNNQLVAETRALPEYRLNYKSYYPETGQLEKEYTVANSNEGNFVGKYSLYYENGNPKIIGQYYDGTIPNIRDGKWVWCNPDGTVAVTELYKACVEFYPNGNKKLVGGYVFDDSSQSWKKQGVWEWYSEQGMMLTSVTYELDQEVEK